MKPYISTGDLEAIIGKDVTNDPFATIAIDSACQTVRSMLGQTLNYLAGDVISVNGNGKSYLILPQYPVVNVSAITVDDTALTDGDWLWERNGLLFLADGSAWSEGLRNVEVTYSHGYAFLESTVEDDPTDLILKPDRMPADIRRVTLELAARIFLGSGTGQDDVQENAQGPGPTTLTPEERVDLLSYREVRVG